MPTPLRLFWVAALLSACADTAQTQACQDYVACQQAIDAQLGQETDLLRFEAAGECWGGIEAGAQLCDRSCVKGLEFLRARQPDLPEECG